MFLEHLDQGLSLSVHPLDGLHALVCFVPQEIDVAHQPQPLEQEDLLLRVTFFVGQHEVAKLRCHHLGQFKTPLRHVPLDLEQRLRGVLHTEHGNTQGSTPNAIMPLLVCGAEMADPFRYQRHPSNRMNDRVVLAISGTPGVGKSQLAARMQEDGWSVLSLTDLAQTHDCLGEVDASDGAAPIDIHRLAETWEAPEEGRWVVDGHLAHLLDVDGVVLLRCSPAQLGERLAERGYDEAKIRANVEWELTAGHWAELLEFEIEVPLLELDAGQHPTDELQERITAWVADGLPGEPLADQALGSLDWLGEYDAS